MTAYVADSAASAPPPRGLPLSLQAPARHSTASSVGRAVPGVASGDDWDESEATSAVVPPVGEDDGPPLEELEAQMAGDIAAGGAAGAPRAPRRVSGDSEEDEAPAVLPELDDLVARLPEEVRETLDELFRARFVSVKKLPRRVFAPATRGK